MADKTISDLVAASQVNDADLFVLEQNAVAKKLSGQTLVRNLLSMIDGHGGIQSIILDAYGTSGNGLYHQITITMTDGTRSAFTVRDGLKGEQGAASYVWIKWAGKKPTKNSHMSNTPDAWMGIYAGTSSTAPTSYTQYKWYNTKGLTGDPAELTEREVLYQASNSGTTPTGTWQSTIPTVNPGQYLWTHIMLTFSGGNSVDWYEVARQGENGVNGLGAVSTVNDIGPDTNNNVSLAASDIPYGESSNVGQELGTLTADVAAKQATIDVTGLLKGSGSGAVTNARKGTDYGIRSFTITLPADSSSWVNNTYTAEHSLFLASGYAYQVGPAYGSIDDFTAAVIYAENVTASGEMVFHCKSVPENPVVMNIFRMVSA